MVKILKLILESSRPRQTLKNLALLAPLVFSGNLFIWPELVLSLIGIFIFSLLTATIYLFNDIIDIEKDRVHPFKKLRPIASGRLSIKYASLAMFLLAFISLILAYQANFFFFFICLTYLLLQIVYTVNLKNIAILDVLIIASGFILRVYAGAIIINVHMSVWFLLCVVSASLFLAVGKRRSELAVLENGAAIKHRRVFIHYQPQLLDHYLAMFATSAWLSYALFAFFEPAPLISYRFPFLVPLLIKLPLAVSGTNKWLMITLPLVIFGIMRYSRIIFEGSRAESPEKVILSDRPLLIAVALWGFLTILVIYILQ